MNHVLKLGAALGLAAFGLAGMPAAQAQVAQTVITGQFTQDDNAPLFSFTVNTPGTVNLFTTSYGGGTNLDGSTTAAGGFDPILSLFDSSGNLLADEDDSPIANPDPMTGSQFDSGLQYTFTTPGTYQVAVTEYDNFPTDNSLADGFQEAGQGNFTGTKFGTAAQAGLGFIDVDQSQRTGNFTLNIGNGAFQPVPEASTTVSLGLLLTLGLGGLFVSARKKAQSSAA
jgi:hypothetical protein